MTAYISTMHSSRRVDNSLSVKGENICNKCEKKDLKVLNSNCLLHRIFVASKPSGRRAPKNIRWLINTERIQNCRSETASSVQSRTQPKEPEVWQLLRGSVTVRRCDTYPRFSLHAETIWQTSRQKWSIYHNRKLVRLCVLCHSEQNGPRPNLEHNFLWCKQRQTWWSFITFLFIIIYFLFIVYTFEICVDLYINN